MHSKEPWGQGEMDYLRASYGKVRMSEIMEYLGRTRCSIERKAWRMGLYAPPTGRTTKDEQYLRKHYQSQSAERIAMELGRTVSTIRRWVLEMRLVKRPSRKWLPEDDTVIRIWYDQIPHREIAAMLDRPLHQVRQRASRMGIAKPQKQMRWTHNQIRQVVTMREQGHSWQEVCRQTGFTRWQVVAACVRAQNAL